MRCSSRIIHTYIRMYVCISEHMRQQSIVRAFHRASNFEKLAIAPRPRGMEFIRELEPNYEYVSRTSRRRRMNFTIEEESAVLHENSNVSSAIITALH